MTEKQDRHEHDRQEREQERQTTAAAATQEREQERQTKADAAAQAKTPKEPKRKTRQGKFEAFTSLNEQGAHGHEVWIHTDQVVAVIGDESVAAVRVQTVSGAEYRVVQEQGEGCVSVLARLAGGDGRF